MLKCVACTNQNINHLPKSEHFHGRPHQKEEREKKDGDQLQNIRSRGKAPGVLWPRISAHQSRTGASVQSRSIQPTFRTERDGHARAGVQSHTTPPPSLCFTRRGGEMMVVSLRRW